MIKKPEKRIPDFNFFVLVLSSIIYIFHSTADVNMEKPIIATTLSGLYVSSEPWKKAHILWFDEAAEQLGDESVKQWAEKPDYFKGVDIVMKRLYPELSETERTVKAREKFFDEICRYIEMNPEVKNEDVIEYFSSIKDKYTLALITTNTREAAERILTVIGIRDLFDITECAFPDEKDNKIIVFERFIQVHGKPALYIGGDRKDTFSYCSANQIPCVFANFEKVQDIESVETCQSLDALAGIIEKL